ncbi:hypothetical protein VPAL9027_01757 [Vibrio palustris]|uniref:Uncharacterized protein n=2 Tax=Vibrio palustris TaxID=1918946 RepID=A0A1R4B4E8_9VIBR|nr:hypothetical protein VPAL9027_01757 [Vibrio palustris]
MRLIFSSSMQPLVNGAELCSELAIYLALNKSDFEQRLIPDLTYIDQTAHNVNGIQVERVEYITGELYQLYYGVDWEVFRGCSDIYETGIQHEKVSFTLHHDGVIEMEFPSYHERDTHDEF